MSGKSAARSARRGAPAARSPRAGGDETSSEDDDDSTSSGGGFDWRAAARAARQRREHPRRSGALAGSAAALGAQLAPRAAANAPAARDVAALSPDSAPELLGADDAALSERSISSDDPSPRKRRRGRRIRHALSSSDDDDEEDEGDSDDLFCAPWSPLAGLGASAASVASGAAQPCAARIAAPVGTPGDADSAAAARDTPLARRYSPQRWLMGPAAQSPLGAGAQWAAAPVRAEQTVLAPPFAARAALPARRGGAAPPSLPLVLKLFGTTVARDEALTKHLPGLVAACGRALSEIEALLLRAPAQAGDVAVARSRIDSVADAFDRLLRWAELPPSPLRPTHGADQLALEKLLRPCLTSFAPIVSWAAGDALGGQRARALRALEHALLSFVLRLPAQPGAVPAWRDDLCLRQLLLTLFHRPALLRLSGAAALESDGGGATDHAAALGFWCAAIARIHSRAQLGAAAHGENSRCANFWAALNALVEDNVATLPAALSCIGGRAGCIAVERVGDGAQRTDDIFRHVRFLWAVLLRASELLMYEPDCGAAGGATTRFRAPSGATRSGGAVRSNWRLARVLIDAAGASDDATVCYRRCSALASLWREPSAGGGEATALSAVLSSLRERGALRGGGRGGLAELRADAALHADPELQALL